MQNSEFKIGFTLIELLVVITIIGILVALGTTAYGTARAQARDAQRRNDLRAIQNALQLYFNDNSSYPSSDWVYSSQGGTWIPGLDGRYIGKLPKDPKASSNCLPNTANCFNYAYYSLGWCDLTGRTYILTTRLETYTEFDLSQKPYYNPNGTFCSNWTEDGTSEGLRRGLLVVQP